MPDAKYKVLIIDDDPFVSEIFAPSMKKKGLAVAVASDGLSGLELIKKEPPDIILLDIVMPGMDGYGVLQELKSKPETANIPVIMLSNLAQQEDIERSMSTGADGFLMKHQSLPSEVADKVFQLVTTKRAAKK